MPERFAQMQTVHIDDALMLRIPRRWQVHREGEAFWSCYEDPDDSDGFHDDDGDTGTLWIERLDLQPDRPMAGSAATLRFVARTAGMLAAEQALDLPGAEVSVDFADDRVELRAREESEQDGTDLVHRRWTYVLPRGGVAEVWLFSLIIVAGTEQTPGMESLSGRLETEIRNSVFGRIHGTLQ